MIYDLIKEMCKKKGIRVSAVEKEAGLSAGAISKWNTCSPTLENASAVAKVLNCTVDDLLMADEKDSAAVENKEV
ncbi:MAG: helix-turn-helix domain-containing protein [Agathobacter sp.]